MNTQSKAYLVGEGIRSSAAAAFMIRDGGVPGENTSILEVESVMGGSLDGAGNPDFGLKTKERTRMVGLFQEFRLKDVVLKHRAAVSPIIHLK